MLFASSGIVAGSGHEWGLLLGTAALLWFLLQTVVALARALPIQKERP